jgi:hypothetical protein
MAEQMQGALRRAGVAAERAAGPNRGWITPASIPEQLQTATPTYFDRGMGGIISAPSAFDPLAQMAQAQGHSVNYTISQASAANSYNAADVLKESRGG